MIAGGHTIDSSAPAAVRLVGDLVNTVEWQEDEESWTSASALEDWFAAHLGTHPTLTDVDLAMAWQFREGLRAVLLLHAGHEALPGSIEMLNRVVDQIALRLRFDQSGDPALVAPGGGGLVSRSIARHRAWRSRAGASRRQLAAPEGLLARLVSVGLLG